MTGDAAAVVVEEAQAMAAEAATRAEAEVTVAGIAAVAAAREEAEEAEALEVGTAADPTIKRRLRATIHTRRLGVSNQ